ncbi:hypothetical protein GQ457_03G028140 [Hibiscus cannabinus]
MELLLLVVATVVLLGLAAIFIRLFDALVLTPKRIRSQLGIQAAGESAPPSSLARNFQKAKSKGKQVQRICLQTLQRKHPGMAENGYNINIRGKIMIASWVLVFHGVCKCQRC